MSATPTTTPARQRELLREPLEAGSTPSTRPPEPGSRPEAAYWRAKYQEERERLLKLWVAFQDAEAELERLKGNASTTRRPTTVPTEVTYDERPPEASGAAKAGRRA